MEIVYLLIPIALILVGAIITVFLWAIRSGQFDDLEGPAHRILMDDDEHLVPGQGKRDGDAADAEPSEPRRGRR
jgi:cbb3-type cytochrome oxidase maturation protein